MTSVILVVLEDPDRCASSGSPSWPVALRYYRYRRFATRIGSAPMKSSNWGNFHELLTIRAVN
ncbi:hypothetical protein [Rhodococcus erythropolis]|uniref:hypothetical protein n=1 Tax=Rhodococcus erythropolis TaxID=1833 RepID=UPI003670B10B